MPKYIQKIIPEISSKWKGLNQLELRNTVFDWYKKNLFGKSLKNKDKGYPIFFTNKPGGRKISFGGTLYNLKAESIRFIYELIENAQYNNFGERKTTDNKTVIGYLNFKAKGKIDKKLYHFRISIQFRKDGKLYYNHEVNITK